MTKADAHWVRDTLVGDTVKGAADAGREADVPGVQAFIVDVLQGMDRKAAEAKPKHVTGHTSPEDKQGIYEEEFEKRTGRKLENLVIERDASPGGRILTAKELTSGPMASIIERIRIINRRNPDGSDKYPKKRAQLKNLSICMNSPKPQLREQAADALEILFAWTDSIAGYSWQSPKPTILTFS